MRFESLCKKRERTMNEDDSVEPVNPTDDEQARDRQSARPGMAS